MTTSGGDTTNIAGGDTTVGFQAGAVHANFTVFVLRDDSAKEKFRVGKAYLKSDMPREARELIGRAIAEGYENSEVLFYWILALLSGRSFRQFSDEDYPRFLEARKRIPRCAGDQWGDGLRVINNLLNAAEHQGADIRLVIKELDELGGIQREEIVKHLEMFLVGPIEDQIWERALAQAQAKQLDNDRKNRVWIFFQPKPAPPRVRPPTPLQTTTGNRVLVALTSPLAVAAASYIGWLLLVRGEVLDFLAYLASIAAGYFCCFVKGVEWRHNVERMIAKDQQHHPPKSRASAPPGGFADDADKLFRRYFAKYRPEEVNRSDWRAATAGIRRYLRDEIVEVYREQRVSAGEVAWLIRYRVRDVANRWRDSTLWDYWDQLQTRGAGQRLGHRRRGAGRPRSRHSRDCRARGERLLRRQRLASHCP
jgi:hypothetical protein